MKHLEWIEEDDGNNMYHILEGNCPPKQEFVQRLVNWKDLQYLHDRTVHLNISTRLLESCSLVNLKDLEIDFPNKDRRRTKFEEYEMIDSPHYILKSTTMGRCQVSHSSKMCRFFAAPNGVKFV